MYNLTAFKFLLLDFAANYFRDDFTFLSFLQFPYFVLWSPSWLSGRYSTTLPYSPFGYLVTPLSLINLHVFHTLQHYHSMINAPLHCTPALTYRG